MPCGRVSSVHGSFAIPSLDGIRFVAVTIVFIGHGQTIGGPWPGDVGVTVFFFLSGYLITTLLRREHARTGRISLGKFYLRRALRILPPAYIAIALTVVAGMLGLLPSAISGWGILAEVLSYTNYYMLWAFDTTGSAHTGLPPESSMLWSLAVEEHFYLIFPVALIILLRGKLNYNTIGFILIGALALTPAWRIYLALTGADFYRLYVSTDARFDGLLAGAAMALLANPALGDRLPFGLSGSTVRYVLSPIAAALFILVALAPQSFGLVAGDSIIYLCLVPLFWLVIIFPEGFIGRILNNGIVAHIGVLSFSIYLIHKLVLALISIVIEFPPVVDLISLVVIIGLAQVMYVLVEGPLGRTRRRLEGKLTKAYVPLPSPTNLKSTNLTSSTRPS